MLNNFFEKSGSSKQDFVEMYSQKSIKSIFFTMFASQYLYQYIMKSRAYTNQKRIFVRVIPKLEAVFLSAIEK